MSYTRDCWGSDDGCGDFDVCLGERQLCKTTLRNSNVGTYGYLLSKEIL